MKFKRLIIALNSILLLTTCAVSAQQQLSGQIYLNQLGFYPSGPKIAVVMADDAQEFELHDAATGRVVLTGKLSAKRTLATSNLTTKIADFSSFTHAGTYLITVAGKGSTAPFRIANDLHHPVAVSSLKAFYYQRASMPLEAVYAGKWARAAGHPDTTVLIHPSAAEGKRTAKSTINTTGGWYDAGDYNKYIVNSGISTGTLLAAYEDFPSYFDTLKTQIPAEGKKVPDLLLETLYNIRWMLRMQDPADGGVYNKCTNTHFDAMIMPDQAVQPRYVVQKGTAATLNLAAVAAQAARIFKHYPQQYPGLADSCLKAAVKAWGWAEKHPDVAYDQDEMNRKFEPQVTTGGYGDDKFGDEWIWSAAELFISTGSKVYYDAIWSRLNDATGIPGWSYVSMLGYYSLQRNLKSLPDYSMGMTGIMKKRILTIADRYIEVLSSHIFDTVFGDARSDYNWGSNSTVANQGILLINAYLMTGEQKYITAAISNLDYLMGRNATGYCFVTGMGVKSPLHPHHRPSLADGIEAPVPGFLVGGPNYEKQDKAAYMSNEPELSYTDLDSSYASNEVAINWNAPLVYISNAIEALQKKK